MFSAWVNHGSVKRNAGFIFDGGEFLTADKATERGLQMAAEGAHIIDVGGESTHPGSEPVTVAEELRRVIPVIENLRRKLDVPISIDTSKAEVARAAIEAGASIVNDVTGGRGDDQMLPLVAETKSAFIIMHMQGTPARCRSSRVTQTSLQKFRNFFDNNMPRHRFKH
jgi:dihydropteroate synthase